MNQSTPVPRKAGTRSAIYATAYDDPATQAAVAVLVAARVPAYVAPLVVVTAVHRLDCWAIQDGDDGATAHLSDRNLLAVAWPEHSAGPRSYGRGERLGCTLRAALTAGGYLTCPQSCRHPAANGAASGSQPCRHQGLWEFKKRHTKLLRDRKEWRRKAAASREAEAVEPAPLARASRASPSPSTTTGEMGSPAPVLPSPAARPPGPSAGLVVGALLDLTGDPDAGGAAPASSTPGAGWEVGREASDTLAEELLLGAEVNRRERRDRRGRDLTVHRGANYLFRLGMAAPGKRAELEGKLGRDPAPGVLLAGAAPDRFALAVRILAGKLRGDLRQKPRRTLEAYARSMVAEGWTKLLDLLTKQAVATAELAAERELGTGAG